MADTGATPHGKVGRPLSERERELVAQVREMLDDPKRSKGGLARLQREILMSDAGVARMVHEIEYGDGFHPALDRAFGKAPQEVVLDGGIGFQVSLPADMSVEALAFIAGLACVAAESERRDEAKVEEETGPIVEVRPQQALSAASGNTSYVNSNPSKPLTTRRLF